MASETTKATKLDSSSTKLEITTNDIEAKDESLEPAEIASTSDKENEATNDTPQVVNNEKEPDSEDDDDDDSDSSEEEESSSEDDVFSGLTQEQKDKLKSKMNQQLKGYNEQMDQEKIRQIKQTKEQISFNLQIEVNDEEAEFIAEFVENNNQNLEQQLQDEGCYFLQSMKEMMEQRKQLNDASNNNNNNDELDDYQYNDDDDDDEDEDWVMNEKKKKSNRAKKRAQKGVGKNTNLDGKTRCGRLLLNDALKNVESMEGWSDARQKAWKNRKTSPNAYFYRFNVPGQKQGGGKWKPNEHALFMKRVRDFGVNDQWGLFSKAIPGRVGYQCSNYWRGLVKDGSVSDPNYHYDGKKLHFKRNTKSFAISSEYRKYAITINKDRSKTWSDLPQKHPKHPSVEYCEKVKDALRDSGNGSKKRKNEDWNDEKSTRKKRRRNKKKKTWDEDDDDAFMCKVSIKTDTDVDDTNPMPDFIDIMTGVNVEKPAISPYGHVLGYDTWTKILRTAKLKNLCPFTLQKLTRRSLVKLTKDNYDDYKDQITNITKEQSNLLASINK